MLDKIKYYWMYLQELCSLDGGLYIDVFAIVYIIRLIAPLRGYPPVTYAESTMWAATISAFAYSNKRPRP